jgi:serine/threonine protein kinase
VVYIAKDSTTKSQVAIKTIEMEKQPSKKGILNELMLLKELNHKNIINFIESYYIKNDKNLWIVMEYMDGGRNQ